MGDQIVLKNHHLQHIPALRVHDNVMQRRFMAGCSMDRCNAVCCRGGVWADSGERDNILAHAAVIQKFMDPEQEHEPKLWFEDGEVPDQDFPSGRAVGTRANEKGCVFLKADGKCVLQSAAMSAGMNPFALKPFYCVAFPITIEHGELMLDDPEHGYRPECCSSVDRGTLSVFDVCGFELRFVLGEEGFQELQQRLETTNV